MSESKIGNFEHGFIPHDKKPEEIAREIADLSVRSLVATPETDFKKLRFSLVEKKVKEALRTQAETYEAKLKELDSSLQSVTAERDVEIKRAREAEGELEFLRRELEGK